MICGNCNQVYDENMEKCPYCGAPKQQPAGQQAPPQMAYAPAPIADNGAKGKATGALVCGIIGVVMGFLVPIVGIILGILGMTMGNMAKKNLPEGEKGIATAGFICGIIAVVRAVIMWILSAVIMATAFRYLAY